MFFTTLLALFLGVFIGIFSGLCPGIHINLISALVLSYYGIFDFSIINLCVFIISMAITHTFLDAIPSIYLGAPDESKAMCVLPGHRMLLQGHGHDAIIYTLLGSFSGLLLAVITFPLIIWTMVYLDPLIKNYIGYLLIVVMGYMILREKNWLWAFIMFSCAGILGILVLNMPNLNQPMFHLLSGLFGLSILLTSLVENTNIPKQKEPEIDIEPKIYAKATGASTFVGILAAFLPGFGSSQAAIVGQQFIGNIGDKGFLILVGGISTVNMLVSIATVYTLQKARNGAIVVMQKIVGTFDLKTAVILVAASVIAGALSFILGLMISKKFCKLIQKVNYQKLVMSIMVLIVIMSIVFDGFTGILILIVSTSLGFLASKIGIAKNHLMGCLVLPVILFFML